MVFLVDRTHDAMRRRVIPHHDVVLGAATGLRGEAEVDFPEFDLAWALERRTGRSVRLVLVEVVAIELRRSRVAALSGEVQLLQLDIRGRLVLLLELANQVVGSAVHGGPERLAGLRHRVELAE